MPNLTVPAAAAISRLATRLAAILTNSVITEVAKAASLRVNGSNKSERLKPLLAASWRECTRAQMEGMIRTLTLAAYDLHTSKKVIMSDDDVNAVIREMRILRLRPQSLAHKGWRTSLRKSQSAEPTPSSEPVKSGSPGRKPYPDALAHIQELVQRGTNPQMRGPQLEHIVHEVLVEERLSPVRRIISPGEEIDLGFTLDGQHYLVECKWEGEPIGVPTVTGFMAKVMSKAEGTFGVVLSMSGFVRQINEKVTRGRRLNCVGLTHTELMAVLEGRASWTETVRRSRQLASTQSLFVPTR
jgi:hypothetical protein